MVKRYMDQVHHQTVGVKTKDKDKDEGMIRTALFFAPPQMQALRALSAARGSPVAEIVRRAVQTALDASRAEWEPLLKKSK